MNPKDYEFDISIVLLTYQQGDLVDRALNSLLRQECSASVELIISDDASTDDTKQKILNVENALKEKYPTTLILRDSNVGMSINLSESLLMCKGRFTAYLEGDDYWIDPYHIQKCYDAISSATGLSAVTSGYERVDLKSNKSLDAFGCDSVTEFKTCSDLGYFPLLGASMWRSDLIMHIPRQLSSCMIDTIIWHYLFALGRCHALTHTSLSYVVTGIGVHSGLSLDKCLLSHLNRYEMIAKFDDSASVKKEIEFWLWWIVEQSCERNDNKNVRLYSQRLVRHYLSLLPVKWGKVLKYSAVTFFPFILSSYKRLKNVTEHRTISRL